VSAEPGRGEHPARAEENRRIWDANARWWDDRIGDGNEFQTLLIEPATEQLLAEVAGDLVLDIACGAGRFARRLADLGARVVAFDGSERFIERARQRTPEGTSVEFRVLDACDGSALQSLGEGRFDKAVCTMGLMDMPELLPLYSALPTLLKPNGTFVLSVTHPCFNTVGTHRFAETYEEDGRQRIRSGVRIASYLTPAAAKTEGVLGQPEPQFSFHRPLHLLLGPLFARGFVMDGIEEPALPPGEAVTAGVRWSDMPEIPPVLVVRLRLQGPVAA